MKCSFIIKTRRKINNDVPPNIKQLEHISFKHRILKRPIKALEESEESRKSRPERNGRGTLKTKYMDERGGDGPKKRTKKTQRKVEKGKENRAYYPSTSEEQNGGEHSTMDWLSRF
ncbi:hypothetical protein K435DRAFT_780301 [Dendrothele bispora CBS 962.96]|uniref:Uncharacterized protein n=1 Tax=Dendrothele bispora (strain CBS 962.96) TaxID=1314807 RepID=A0A4S8LTH1_DENBC|nr:hypothetical protein K435DRAFT_780301 [Dendrothele bispora CBS 962.96]